MPMLEDTRWPDGEEPFADAVLEESESEAASFLRFIKGLILFWGFSPAAGCSCGPAALSRRCPPQDAVDLYGESGERNSCDEGD